MITRRGLILGAPAIILTPGLLMPVRRIVLSPHAHDDPPWWPSYLMARYSRGFVDHEGRFLTEDGAYTSIGAWDIVRGELPMHP